MKTQMYTLFTNSAFFLHHAPSVFAHRMIYVVTIPASKKGMHEDEKLYMVGGRLCPTRTNRVADQSV